MSVGCGAVLDLIEIRGLRALGVIGVRPEEQERAQPFEIDFDLEADLASAGQTDDLADTIDYGLATAVAERVVTGERHQLLERVAQRIADELLALDRVDGVRVTIRKLRPPLPHDVATSAVTIRRRRPRVSRAFLALGSNLGDRVAYLRAAVAAMPDLVACSPVYETDPVGGPDGQGPYLNMVVQLDTRAHPGELLAVARALEAAAGRERVVHWGPRTLDVDVIWIDGVEVDEPDLVVPHPRLR